ncbi:MAG: exo-alpha-sialidase [Acidobacteria bacterium]|nr:MAG: exo-alpha-sialidase [Acidobacteriota bacterium]REK09169.1 MAG: exo-alpha-sialidase [Acidobacteriota bacterium]
MGGRALVMVGTQKGAFFYRSDPRRDRWEIEGPYLEGWEVTTIGVDGRGERPVLYAGVGHFVYGPTVHRSDDLGATWRQLEARPSYPGDSGFSLNRIWTIVPGRDSQPGVLYAGVDEAGIFRSDDDGASWQGLDGLNRHPTRAAWGPGAGGLCCHTILLDPHDDRRLWVGISAVGTFRSDDGGETWQVKTDGLPIIEPREDHPGVGSCVHRMVLDPEDSNNLYQQNHQGVFRSRDAGDSWQRIESGVPSTFGFPMVMHPRDPKTLFVVPQKSDEQRTAIDGRLAVYRTSDGGDSWAALRSGLPDHTFQGVLRGAMATDALDPCGIYFGTTGGQVFASADAGESWRPLPGALPRISSVTAIELAD